MCNLYCNVIVNGIGSKYNEKYILKEAKKNRLSLGGKYMT